VELAHVAATNAVFIFCQHYDRAAFRRFVGKRGELRRVREFLFAHSGHRNKFRRLAVAESSATRRLTLASGIFRRRAASEKLFASTTAAKITSALKSVIAIPFLER
jgi:hypothetical protein